MTWGGVPACAQFQPAGISMRAASPATPQAMITGITPAFNRKSAPAAASPITSASGSSPCAGAEASHPCGQNTCHAKNSARLTMTPTTAAVIPESGAVNLSCPCVVSTSGPPARMNRNDGRNVKKVATQAPATPASASESGPNSARVQPPDEADERDHHDQRPGRRFAEREPVDHLHRREPRIASRPRPDRRTAAPHRRRRT